MQEREAFYGENLSFTLNMIHLNSKRVGKTKGYVQQSIEMYSNEKDIVNQWADSWKISFYLDLLD